VELPSFPALQDGGRLSITSITKSKTFCHGGWKSPILAISVILWVPAFVMDRQSRMDENEIIRPRQNLHCNKSQKQEEQIQALRPHPSCWENSLNSGIWSRDRTGIRPLGHDWKRGICVDASCRTWGKFVSNDCYEFYSIGGDPRKMIWLIRQKSSIQQIRPMVTRYTKLPRAFLLMVFYAFAMQCMSNWWRLVLSGNQKVANGPL